MDRVEVLIQASKVYQKRVGAAVTRWETKDQEGGALEIILELLGVNPEWEPCAPWMEVRSAAEW